MMKITVAYGDLSDSEPSVKKEKGYFPVVVMRKSNPLRGLMRRLASPCLCGRWNSGLPDWSVQPLKAGSLFALILFLVIGCAAPIEPARDSKGGEGAQENEWRRYQGAWFSIEYPSDFIARPSLAAKEDGLFDSVFFSARGDEVSFYVLSPQWRREARDAEFKPAQESRLEFTEQTDDGLIKRSTLIRARDGSYERLIESFISLDQTVNWTFQFIYRDEKLKKRYVQLYDRFKASLQQFAD
ncbi:MAG: hypothetical protein GY792_25830 [Gammaproteobacteria bacterium]|nr:hypothetical protein [Gammaproteobacteria bacterium]